MLYFLTLDPATLAPPADPRPALPTLFYDASQSTLVGQSDWTTNRSMLHWRCSWNTINHQNADGGLFQFFRKGEFLTKEFSGYDAYGYGQASWLHNTLALQNHCPAGTPQNLQWFETPLWETGSQWMLGTDAGDPLTYCQRRRKLRFHLRRPHAALQPALVLHARQCRARHPARQPLAALAQAGPSHHLRPRHVADRRLVQTLQPLSAGRARGRDAQRRRIAPHRNPV